MTRIPSTSDYLAYRALVSPGSVVLIHDRREFTCAQFHRDRIKFTNALRQFDLPAGSAAAISCSDMYVHWLLLLAFECRGIATASFMAAEGASCLHLLARMDLVIADDDAFAGHAARFHHLTADWLNEVFLSDGEAETTIQDADIRSDDAVRIVRSSGTTGGQKMMIKTRSMIESRMARSLYYGMIDPSARCLWPSLRFSVHSVYAWANCALRVGAVTIFDDTLPVAEAIERYRVTHLPTIPFLLEKILNELPNSFRKPPRLVVNLMGAALPARLRERALSLLASDIQVTYSSNEVERISAVDPDGVGTIVPGMQVEVVGEAGECLPTGETGRIRVMAPWQVKGYLGDPEATALMFQDGWFYTGDVGVMIGPRQLKVLGRYDELLNIGGLKVPPDSIEEMLRASLPDRLGVTDFGVTLLENADGMEEICVCAVTERRVDPNVIGDEIGRLMPALPGQVRVRLVSGLPRTESGKLIRSALKALVSGIGRPP